MNALASVNGKLAALVEAEATLIDDHDTFNALRRDRRQDPEFVGLTAHGQRRDDPGNEPRNTKQETHNVFSKLR